MNLLEFKFLNIQIMKAELEIMRMKFIVYKVNYL